MRARGEAARKHLIRVAGWSAVLGVLLIVMGIEFSWILVLLGTLVLVGSLWLGYSIGRVGG